MPVPCIVAPKRPTERLYLVRFLLTTETRAPQEIDDRRIKIKLYECSNVFASPIDAATIAEAVAVAGPSRIADAATFAVAAANTEPTNQKTKLIYGAGSRMDGRDKPAARVDYELIFA